MKQDRTRDLPCRVMSGIALTGLLTACAGTPQRPSEHHLGPLNAATSKVAPVESQTNAQGDSLGVPTTVDGPLMPPRPRVIPKLETYSVVVSQVEIAELLFAMARDAKLNLDVHPAVTGKVTINAIDQTLPQILKRLSTQINLRYELIGSNLSVMPDTPFVRYYNIDYVNMTRNATSNSNIATNITAAGGSPLGSGGSGSASNNSTTQIVNASNNQFWNSLVNNLTSIVTEPVRAGTQTGSQGGSQSGSQGGSQGGSGSTSSSGGSTGGSSTGGGSTGGGSTGGGSTGGGSTGGGSGSSSTQANALVVANPETGLISVRATGRLHERVREYIDRVMNSARRQVLIEATIAEVQLSDQYQQGVNWSRVKLDGTGFAFSQQPNGSSTLPGGTVPGTGPGGITFPNSGGTLPGGASASGGATSSLAVLRYLNNTSSFGNLGAALSLLQSFGKVKVLSSPKISVLNNQTAVLKVVDNRVYFTIGVQVTPGTATTAPLVTYTSTANTVPVGFVMSVTPQIEESGGVTMNVRPTISRIVGYVNDPSPALASNNVVSRIPEIQTREIESILKVQTGDVAVMGGLMQESIDDRQDSVPGAASLPFFGNAFKYRNETSTKTELVIFLRPLVIKDASMEGDYNALKDLQPGSDFFSRNESLRTYSNDSQGARK